MSDTLGLMPIVNGSTIVQQEVVNQTTAVAGTPAIMPVMALWNNGAPVSSADPLPMTDGGALINTGQIVTNTGQISTQTGSVVAQAGSINAGVSALVSRGLATSANQTAEISTMGSVVTNTQSIVTELAGIQTSLSSNVPVTTNAAPLNIRSLANGGTITTTVGTILPAGSATAGANLISNAGTWFGSFGANAGTVAGGDVYMLVPGQPFDVPATNGSVTAIALSGTLVLSGNGYTPTI